MNNQKDKWTEEEIIAEALKHYWEKGGENAMIPSKSLCYVSHGRAYICNNNEILAVYKFKINDHDDITFQ